MSANFLVDSSRTRSHRRGMSCDARSQRSANSSDDDQEGSAAASRSSEAIIERKPAPADAD